VEIENRNRNEKQGKSLDEAFKQLQVYMQSMPAEDVPDLWLVCDFENIRLCRRYTNELWHFKTKDLRKHIKKFAVVAGYETERDNGIQIEVNVKAAEKMAKLYDALKDHGYDGHELEVYMVRFLFCLFAGDTGIFPKGNFYTYIKNSKEDGSDLSHRISDLFDVLNMDNETRAKKKLLSDELKQFQYINGGLFEHNLPRADFDTKTRKILLECRENFDWSTISPAIFGAMFQGVMDKTKRREMGAHYTSVENIEKLINPLFLEELYNEFERVKPNPAALDRFHDKIARLKFLDPACGCGNFLIVTYGKLRELELEILKMKFSSNQMIIDISPLLKVSVEQFYGIEYEEFPCQIAQVGMWLIDHQMNLRVSEQFGMYFARLPLTQGATIVNENAVRLDWKILWRNLS
jgi:type I restriction-modification system DNA methylase subunit